MELQKVVVAGSPTRHDAKMSNISFSTTQKIDISWRNLTYKVKTVDKDNQPFEKTILNDCSGFARAGELLAIIGSSGAGKTSLLNLLSCRIQHGVGGVTLTGDLHANGKPYSSHSFGRFAGYVMQNDVLMGTLTPRESFMFAANLRLNASHEERVKKVDFILEELKLLRCADTRIGDDISKGISGGERKRTSIGVELLSDPSVVFLDEPTSGLDSFTAYVTINLMRQLAKSRMKTIVFTIHQPNSDIFNLFDRLLLMIPGRYIFQGRGADAVPYFKSIGHPCPPFSNPADFFMEQMSMPTSEAGKAIAKARFEKFGGDYDREMLPKIQAEIDTLNKDGYAAGLTAGASFAVQFWELAKRAFVNFGRNPILFQGRIFQTLFFCFLLGSIFFRLDDTFAKHNADGSVQTDSNGNPVVDYTVVMNRNGALFMITMSQFMFSLMGTLLTFPPERAVFLKEASSNLYHIVPYYFSKMLVELPFLIFYPLLFSSIIYYIIGLYTPGINWLTFAGITILLSFTGNSMGIMTGCLFTDAKVGVAMAPMIFVPFMLFAGFYINADSLPVWLAWFQYLSPIKYGLEALAYNEYNDRHLADTLNPLKLLALNLGLSAACGYLLLLAVGFRMCGLLFLRLQMRTIQ